MANIADDFDRANGGLGANWAVSSGTWAIVSNEADQAAASGRHQAVYQTALDTDDNRSEALLNTGAGGLFVRGNAAGTTGYFSNKWGGAHREIWKVVTGTPSFLGEPGVITDAGALYMEANGSTITIGVVGGGSGNITDSSITTGKNVGLSSDGPATFDNFVGGDIGSVPPPDLEEGPQMVIRRSNLRLG